MPRKAQSGRKSRPKLTPEQKAQAQKKKEERKFRQACKDIFYGAGFTSFRSEFKEFTLQTPEGNRTTELDAVFVYQNVVVVLEDTCSLSPNTHLSKKCMFYQLATRFSNDFISCLINFIPGFKEHFESHNYDKDQYVVRFLYFSMHPVASEYCDTAIRSGGLVVERPLTNYFDALVKNIAKSAKFELFKFMDIPFSEIGSVKLSGGNSADVSTYNGFLLPEANSSYPSGFKIVSFYADPHSLLQKSYVLRKHGWIEPNLSYQRILESAKIKSMRKYLSKTKRVYLGNVIVTLPNSTQIGDLTTGKLIEEDLKAITPARILLPNEYNVVGLIDGQHRVYSYHEGTDNYEGDISRLRPRQNLLVTGIIYPGHVTEEKKRLFEAELFLEINSKQTKVKSVLTQEIELFVNPFSSTAIAKSILMQLAKKGPLKGLLEEHVFDDSTKLKVSSIVSYGLKPLVKREGADSLFAVWPQNAEKDAMFVNKDRALLKDFVDFAVNEINCLLLSAKLSNLSGWNIGHQSKFLTPTSLNGFLKCLRLIIEGNKVRTTNTYSAALAEIEKFDFKSFKSSQWNKLGIRLFTKYFQ